MVNSTLVKHSFCRVKKCVNIDKMVRYDKDGTTVLPKYMKYVNWANEEGYHIVSHPLCKHKKFVTTLNTVEIEKKRSYCIFGETK